MGEIYQHTETLNWTKQFNNQKMICNVLFVILQDLTGFRFNVVLVVINYQHLLNSNCALSIFGGQRHSTKWNRSFQFLSQVEQLWICEQLLKPPKQKGVFAKPHTTNEGFVKASYVMDRKIAWECSYSQRGNSSNNASWTMQQESVQMRESFE